MAKYNGMGMKGAMLNYMNDVTEVLDRHNITGEERDIVTDTLKEAFFQWCESNAVACYKEEIMKQLMTEEQFQEYTRLFVHNFFPYEMEKLSETYAWYEEVTDESNSD